MFPSVRKDIVEVYQKNIDIEYKSPVRLGQRKQLELDQKRREERELETYNPCPVPVPEMAPLQAGLRFEEIKLTLRKYFFDERRMRAVHCALAVVLRDGPGTNAVPARVRSWFEDPRPIGAPSVSGVALLTKLRDNRATSSPAELVVKAPRDPNESLVHEAVVGLRLNSLRAKVPNFAYVFNVFNCSPPYTSEGKDKKQKVGSWCLRDSPTGVSYIIYEGIFPSVSLKKHVETCSFLSFLGIYLQIADALELAQREVGFEHGDLHDENVQVRDMASPISLFYDTSVGARYIETSEIATMIDFGLSRVLLSDGTSAGVYGYEKYGRFPDKPLPLFDSYKVLLMSMRTMLQAGNKACFAGAARILRFFNSVDRPEVIVKEQSSSYYSLPNDPVFGGYQIRDLLQFIESDPGIPRVATTVRTAAPLYSCEAKPGEGPGCMTDEQALASIGLSEIGRPLTLLDLYTAYVDTTDAWAKTEIAKKGRPTYITSIKPAIFNLESGVARFVSECERLLSTFPSTSDASNGAFPSLEQVDQLVMCEATAADQDFTAEVISVLGRVYLDDAIVARAYAVREKIDKIRTGRIDPSIQVMSDLSDLSETPNELRGVYSNAKRALL